jgi:hypothetical protein
MPGRGYVTEDGFRLGQWVSIQRVQQNKMPQERKARLDGLGFVWDALAAKWEEGFRHLQAFVKEQGHCRVSQRHRCADEYGLGQWVSEQRLRKDSMPLERRARLDTLGFVWDALTERWEEGFEHLKAYVQEHRHCTVPAKHVTADGYPLGRWVVYQREKEDCLLPEQKARLDALGFDWNPRTNKRAG